MKKLFALALGVLALTGCPTVESECSTNADCGDRQVCSDGTCYAGTCANGGITCEAGFECVNNTCTSTAPSNFTVGGSVSGLNGTVVLSLGSQTVSVSANGNYTFPTALATGSAYAVSVDAEPSLQSCTVANGSGSVASANVTNVNVTCADVDVAAASAGIQAFLAAAAGAQTTPISVPNVLVTFLRPAVEGGDPAGFFVQAEANGPAMFVELDPATQTPALSQGDRISFTVTTKAIASQVHRATAISDLTKVSSAKHSVTEAPPAGLLQDVSSKTDVVGALDAYAYELISVVDAEIIGNFFGAGAGYQAAELDTAGLTPNAGGTTGFRARLPTTLVAELDLMKGCVITVHAAPMWRNNATAQISPVVASDVTVKSCPAPTVTSVVATSETKVVVFFDRLLDASTVSAADFTINGLAVSAATVSGKQVELTTATQTAGAPYTLTLGEIKDTLGTATTTTTANFYGYSTVAAGAVVINEVDYDQTVNPDSAEFIELYNGSGATQYIDGLVVLLINGGNTPGAEYTRVALSTAKRGDGTATNEFTAGSYLVIASANYFASAAGLALGANVLRVVLPGTTDLIQNGGTDAIGLVHYATGVVVDALSYEGQVPAATVQLGTGAQTLTFAEGTGTTAADSGNGSLGRSATSADTNNNQADFALKAVVTPGAANP